ncbi:ABC transporter ATP-binding protein [Actinophytocola sediminis]
MTAFTSIVRHAGPWLPVIGASSLVGTLGMLALPMVLGRAVDTIVSGVDSGLWILLAAGLILLGVLSDLVDAFAGTACVAGTTAWLRDRLVRRVLAAGDAGRRGFDTGDLVGRVSGNAAEAAQAGPSVVTVGSALLPPVGSLVLLTYLDLWLAVAFLCGAALVGVVLRVFTRRSTEVIGAYLTTQGRLATRLTESLTGARTIAAAGTIDRERARVLEPLPELHEQGRRMWRVLSSSAAQSAVAGPLVLVAVLATGGLALHHGRITPGELFAAGQYALLGAGLGGLTSVFARLARSRAGAARAGEVLAVAATAHGGGELAPGTGRLELRGASVRVGDVTLLSEVDLEVPGGAAVAVVGRSGSGKSVLAALAARLRDPDEGEVLLDGVPLRSLSHEALRAAVGCAFERPVLVGASVADAITPGAAVADVEAAARAVHAHEFVSRLPHGYRTPLAAAPMSGGERQRLGLARAWPASRLLVLDDATSSLDMVTEMRISRTLTEGGDRTRLVVTHRRSTAARADLVVWLDAGRVRAIAPHTDLWTDPAYREIFG